MRPNRWAWPLLGRDRILPNSLWISDEIDSFVRRNEFWKKTWVNYEAPVVQIWPVSSWIDRYLSFLRGGYITFSMQTTGELWIKHDIISCKIWFFYFCNIFLVDASQKNPFFALKKWKMSFFTTKIKTPRINIVCYPKMHTCAHYEVVWTNYAVVVAITISFGLKAIELRMR
jgi:hypothetical protein